MTTTLTKQTGSTTSSGEGRGFRGLLEFSVPALVIGLMVGVVAGLLSLATVQSGPNAVITGLGLGLPIALIGAVYSSLVALKKFPVGVFAPAAGLWLVGFPVAMLVHQAVTQWVLLGEPGLPAGPLWQFFVYNGLLSMGYTIGYLWCHEFLGRHWWARIRSHNRYAEECVQEYMALASSMHNDARGRRPRRRRLLSRRGPSGQR